MKIGGAFKGKYLKQDHIGDKYVAVTIEQVTIEEIDGDDGSKEKKPVLHFVGKDMGMVLNKTNADILTDLLGSDETDDWVGHKIVLFVDKSVMFGGKRVGGIRITHMPNSKPAPPPPVVEEDFAASDEDVPF